MDIPLPRFSFKGIRALGELSVCLPRQTEGDRQEAIKGRQSGQEVRLINTI